MEAKLPLAQKYNAGFVALLWGPSGLPRDASERGVLAAELMQKATEFGILNEGVWIDPIVTPVTSPQSQVQVPSCVEFITMDGEDVDFTSLTKEQVNYIKTTKVLMGKTLYSHSWLEF